MLFLISGESLMNSSSTLKPRVTRSKPALRRAMLELLDTQTLEQITVKDLTAQADVGYATFFRHYPDKDALLHDVAADEIRRLLTMTMPLFHSADMEASTRALCAYVWEHQTIWRILLGGGASATLKEEYLSQALSLLEDAAQPHPWLPDELAVTFSVGALVDILRWWLSQEKPQNVAYMAKVIRHLAVQPIMNNRVV